MRTLWVEYASGIYIIKVERFKFSIVIEYMYIYKQSTGL
jgi:hypothetical protein